VYPLTWSVHDAPLRHGSEAHSSTSVSHVTPAHPLAQVHANPPYKGVHDAPFLHGCRSHALMQEPSRQIPLGTTASLQGDSFGAKICSGTQTLPEQIPLTQSEKLHIWPLTQGVVLVVVVLEVALVLLADVDEAVLACVESPLRVDVVLAVAPTSVVVTPAPVVVAPVPAALVVVLVVAGVVVVLPSSSSSKNVEVVDVDVDVVVDGPGVVVVLRVVVDVVVPAVDGAVGDERETVVTLEEVLADGPEDVVPGGGTVMVVRGSPVRTVVVLI
jgi:hypothetical protein